jgi:dienelactone hydrolase
LSDAKSWRHTRIPEPSPPRYFEESTVKASLVIGFTLVFAAAGRAAVHSETGPYKHGDTVLEGYLAYDDAIQGKRPGILVVHEWLGLSDHAKKRAEMLAELGYVAFAADMYGKGVQGTGPQDGMKLSAPFKADRKLMRARATAGLDVLRSNPKVDTTKLGAIGFCFGGTTVLELARAGTDLRGVVAFHAGLGTPMAAQAGAVKAKVLVCHGGDDPHVPPAEVQAFRDEMQKAGAAWQLIAYGNAVHSFTNPAANDKAHGMAYNAEADRESWKAMKDFFAEVFAK